MMQLFVAGAMHAVLWYALERTTVVLCLRKSVFCSHLQEFRSSLETGDGGGFDMKLNNNVFNALKVHSRMEGKRMARLHEKKEKSTAESVVSGTGLVLALVLIAHACDQMDEKSRLLIFKLINAGIVDEVNGAINTGKEANVYHGYGANSEKQITIGEVAIKVYKTTLNEFKHRQSYIREDYRFKDKFAKSNNQKAIYLCA